VTHEDDIDDSMAANPEPADARAELGYVAPTPRQPPLIAPAVIEPPAAKLCIRCNQPPEGGVLVAVGDDIRRNTCPKCAGKVNSQRFPKAFVKPSQRGEGTDW
jgi:hypothetical protein